MSIPPLSFKAGWHDYRPKDAGYSEFQRFLDYFRETGQIGPKVATYDNAHVSDEAAASESALEICLIDTDELLDHPAAVTEVYCRSVELAYDESILSWGKPEDRQKAESEFRTRMRPLHEVAIDSTGLKPRNKVYSWVFFRTSNLGLCVRVLLWVSITDHCSRKAKPSHLVTMTARNGSKNLAKMEQT